MINISIILRQLPTLIKLLSKLIEKPPTSIKVLNVFTSMKHIEN